MSLINHPERDRQFQEEGAKDHLFQQLERQVAQQRTEWELDAREWKRLQRYQQDIAEWIVDNATNEDGQLVKPRIDAALGGEAFIPCSFTFLAKGRRYHMSLISTVYEIQEL